MLVCNHVLSGDSVLILHSWRVRRWRGLQRRPSLCLPLPELHEWRVELPNVRHRSL